MTARLPQLTDQQARALVGGIGLLVVVVIATMWRGLYAAVAVIGIDVLWLLWNRAELLERLHNLEVLTLGMLPEEIEEEAVGGWPEEEPNPVEPGDAELVTWVVEPDDAPTEEFPAVPVTVPMEIAWDVAAVELVAEEPAPEPVPDWQAEQEAWLKAERARLDEMAWEAL